MADVRLLNWGCGGDLRDEPWVNADRNDYGDRAIQNDLSDPMQCLAANEHFDGIVANHSLQALRYKDVPFALHEFHRVLRPAGVLRVLVPCVEDAFAAYARLDRDWFPEGEQATTAEAFTHYLTWGGDNRTCFTSESLYLAMSDAGFDVHRVSFGVTVGDVPEIVDLDSREHESLIFEGIK